MRLPALLLLAALLALALLPPTQGAEVLHNYYTLQQDTEALAAQYPDLALYQEHGTSTSGLAIFSVDVAANRSALTEAELAALPTMYVDGGHHGNELLGVEAAYYFLEQVLARAAADPDYLAGKRLVVTPMVNADGYTLDCRNNLNGVDLNRNYPYLWGLYGTSSTPTICPISNTYRGSSGGSERETQASMALMSELNLYFYFSAHTGSYDMVLPWKTPYESPGHEYALEIPDWPLYQRFLGAAENASGMDYRDPSGAGESSAWGYGARGALSLVIEVSTTQWSPVTASNTAREEVAEALRNYFVAWENLTLLGGRLEVVSQSSDRVTVTNLGWGAAYNLTAGDGMLAQLDPGATATLARDGDTLTYRRMNHSGEGPTLTVVALVLSAADDDDSLSVPFVSPLGVVLAAAVVALRRRE